MAVDQVENDLRYAQTSGVCVDVTLVNGERLLSGVHSVDEDDDSVSLYAPQHLGDNTTRKRIYLTDIVSLTVTNVRWRDV